MQNQRDVLCIPGKIVVCRKDGQSSSDGDGTDDFDNVMQLEHPPITIGISTGGASPALGVHLRDEIADLIGEVYPLLAEWLGELRPQLKESISDRHQRHVFWKHILNSGVLPLLKAGKQDEAYAHLQDQFNRAVENANSLAEATQA